MNEAILVLNAGSSSTKFSVYRVAGPDAGQGDSNDQLELVSRGYVEGLGSASPRFVAKDGQGATLAKDMLPVPPGGFGHHAALVQIHDWLTAHHQATMRLAAVGHRIVHGGVELSAPTLITDALMAKLERLIPLVPLHQPHNLEAVRAVMRIRPDLPQVACFDTAFHRGRADVTERFGLPDEWYRLGLRRYGFHGLSFESICHTFARVAPPEIADGRLIAAHLGSGCSLCAIRAGRSVDTTMSFSSLDGLPMGTRCGTLDPGVLIFLLRRGMSLDELEDTLYKKAGLLGVSGISNDMRDLLASKEPLAAAAVEYFVYRVAREIGSMAAALGGVDALIFAAGVGENSPEIRARVCRQAAWLGFEIDPQANARNDRRISPPDRSPSVWVIPTDEEIVIARHTLAITHPAAAGAAAGTAQTAAPA